MATISANFTANFTKFYEAVEKAEFELKKFGEGAETAGDRLEKLANRFSGRQIVQQATLVAEAVERVGGVSKLTEKELASVGATVAEASEKMRKLGMEVPASFKAIEDATKKATPPTESWGQSLGKLQTVVQGLIALQAVQWVIGFGKEVIGAADQLTKLSAQTGVSVEWLQKFQVAGDDAGNTIDELAGAVTQMQNRLAGGDKSALAALKQVHLTLDDLRGLKPEDQFVEIARAIAQIEDPAEQVQVAMDLFGRNGATILPTIKRGFDDVKDAAVGMSKDTVKSLDELGDGFTKTLRTTKDWVGTSIAYFYEYSKFAAKAFTGQLFSQNEAAQKKAAELLKDLADELDRMGKAIDKTKGLPPGLPGIVPTATDLAAMRNHVIITDEQIAAQKKLAAANQDAKRSIVELEGVAVFYAGQIRSNMKLFEGAIDQQKGWIAVSEQAQKDNADIGKKIRAQSSAQIQADVRENSAFFDETFAYLKKLPDAFVGPIDQAGKQFQKFGDYIASELPRTILAAVQGGGSVIQSIGSTIGTYLLDPEKSGIGDAIAKGAAKLPGLIGKAVGDFLPGVGALIGPAIEGVKKLFGKMFGAEQKEVTKLRDQFIEAAGGIEALRRAAEGAGVTLDALMSERKKKGLQADIDALTAALAFQKTAMEEVQAAAERYGITLAELGPAMARGELDKQAQQLYKDFELLKSAGLEQVVITNRMADAVNAYIQTAVQMGVEVDAAMKPMLQQFIDAGKLIDANGDAITNLEDSGISFSLTMSEGFKALIATVEKLTDAIARGLGLAIKNIPEPQVKGRVTWNVDPVPQAQGARAMESYQEGTGGFKNFGAGTPVMLHGWEAVVPREDAGAFATVAGSAPAAAAVAGATTVIIHAEGAFFDTPGDLQRLADKVNDALTAKFGLRNSMRAA